MLNENILNRLLRISKLNNNWDGYGACPPSKKTMLLVNSFINKIPQRYKDLLHFEDIIPSAHGTVNIEWEKGIYFVRIEIGEKGSGYYSELPNSEEPYNDDLEKIVNPIPEEILNSLKKLYNF